MSTLPNTPQLVGQNSNEGTGHMRSNELAAGSLSICSGKDKYHDMSSSAPQPAMNALAAGSEYSMISPPRVASTLSDNVHNQLPLRVESFLDMPKTQKTRDHADFAAEDETEKGLRKRARREPRVDSQQKVQIGYYLSEPNVSIYAYLGPKDSLVVEMIRNKTPQAPPDNLSSPGSAVSVSMEKTVLDRDLFPQSLRDLNFELLETRQKRSLVREILEAKRDNQEMNAEAWLLKSQEIHVGFSRQDGNIPIFSHLKRKMGGKLYLSFRIRSSDAAKSNVDFGNRLVGQKDIDYIEKYTGPTFEDSKKAIQEDLEILAQTYMKPSAVQQSKSMLGQEHGSTGTTENENQDYAFEFNLQGIMKNLPAAGSPEERHAKKFVDSCGGVIEFVEFQQKLISEARTEVENLRQSNAEQAKEIEDLKAAMSRVQSQAAPQQTHLYASLRSVDIERGLFESVSSDAGSPGMIMTTDAAAKEHLVELGGKKYEERTHLLECKLKYTGVPTGENIRYNGLSFSRIMDGNLEKFVQNLDSTSLVQSEGRQFLKWITLKEPLPPKKTYQGI